MSRPTGWTSSIPFHWKKKKLKYVASLKSGDSITSDSITEAGEYPVFGGNGLRGYTSAYTHCGKYILIGRQGALCGNINYASGCFWASEHAMVVDIKGEDEVSWLGELLRSMDLNQYSQSAAQPGLAVDVIANLEIPVPPLHEQRAIADFLDRETAQLDTLVVAKERLLELLAEKRRALITRAVTRGLDPTAPLRDSDFPWLGSIPVHWKAVRLKFLAKERLAYGANEAALEDDPRFPRFVRITDITEDGSLRPETFKSLPLDVAEPYLLSEGDVLFARSGATVGKAFIYQPHWGAACFAGYLIRFRCDLSCLKPEFLFAYTQAEPYWQQVREGTIQATIQNFSAEKYGDIVIALPPLSEQRTIVAYIEKETTKLDALRDATERTIRLLKERRAALIAAAVTGKIRVPVVSSEVDTGPPSRL